MYLRYATNASRMTHQEHQELQNVQLWVKYPSCHCPFLSSCPITAEEGWDKYHRDQPSHLTCTSTEQQQQGRRHMFIYCRLYTIFPLILKTPEQTFNSSDHLLERLWATSDAYTLHPHRGAMASPLQPQISLQVNITVTINNKIILTN